MCGKSTQIEAGSDGLSLSILDLWPDDPAVRQRWETLTAWLDPRPGEYVLDVGCGRGAATAYVAGRVGPSGRSVGVECHVDYLQNVGTFFTKDGSPAPIGVCGDARFLAFADESFDAVLCVNVYVSLLSRFVRVLGSKADYY
jgi:ubiquinone/menaquinone biosynthesis C-methylase UbiE